MDEEKVFSLSASLAASPPPGQGGGVGYSGSEESSPGDYPNKYSAKPRQEITRSVVSPGESSSGGILKSVAADEKERLWLSLEHRLLPQHHPASRGSPSRSSTGRLVSYGELAPSSGERQQYPSAPVTPEAPEARAVSGRVGLLLDDKPLRISTVVPGSPADQAGQLKVGDHIIEIDGKPITEDMDLHEVLNMFNGPPGTTLDMVVSRSRGGDSQDTQILRRAQITRGAPQMDTGIAPRNEVSENYEDHPSAMRELLPQHPVHTVSANLVRSPIPEYSSPEGATPLTHFRHQDFSPPRDFDSSDAPKQNRPVLTRTPVPEREINERPRPQGTLESFIIRTLMGRWTGVARAERRTSSRGQDGILDNEAFSPYGVQRVLLLCCNAAAKDTLLGAWGALQSQCALLSLQSTNQDHRHFRQELETRKMESEIKIRHSLWVPTGVKVEKKFASLASTFFGTPIFSRSDPTSSDVSQWIHMHTGEDAPGFVDQVLERHEIGVVGVSVISAAWAQPFWKPETRTREFTLEDGSKVACRSMSQRGRIQHVETNAFEAVDLRCGERGELQCILVRPRASMEAAVERFAETLDGGLKFTEKDMQLEVPLATVGGGIDLLDVLRDVQGFQEVLSSEPDFGGLTPAKVRIGMVKEELMIRIDEHGLNARERRAQPEPAGEAVGAETGLVVSVGASHFSVVDIHGLMDVRGRLQGQAGYQNREIMVGDRLMAVEGTKVMGMSGEGLERLLRGPYNSLVTLTLVRQSVEREGGTEESGSWGAVDVFDVALRRHRVLQSKLIPPPTPRDCPKLSYDRPYFVLVRERETRVTVAVGVVRRPAGVAKGGGAGGPMSSPSSGSGRAGASERLYPHAETSLSGEERGGSEPSSRAQWDGHRSVERVGETQVYLARQVRGGVDETAGAGVRGLGRGAHSGGHAAPGGSMPPLSSRSAFPARSPPTHCRSIRRSAARCGSAAHAAACTLPQHRHVRG